MDIQKRNNDKEIDAPLKNKWFVMKPEEEIRQKYICRLVDSYDYDLKQMNQELKVTNSQRGRGAVHRPAPMGRAVREEIYPVLN